MSRDNTHTGGRAQRLDISCDPSDFQPVTPYSEELRDEYQETREALEELLRKEEEVRRQAEMLENLTKKEAAFSKGRSYLIGQIEDYMDLLDREAEESRRIADECDSALQRFHHHLRTIRNLSPASLACDRNELLIELEHGLRQLEAAEEDIDDVMPLISLVSQRKEGRLPGRGEASKIADSNPAGGGFDYWIRAGLAFCLPLGVIALVIVLIYFLLK